MDWPSVSQHDSWIGIQFFSKISFPKISLTPENSLIFWNLSSHPVNFESHGWKLHLPLKVGGNVIKVAIWLFQRCVYMRLVSLYPIRLVSWCLGMPWYATSGSPDEAWTPGWHIFRLKMRVIWVRVHILHGRGERGSFWPGNVWDICLSEPVWPLIWRDGYSTNNNRLLAHILSYLLIPDILAKSQGEWGKGGKTSKSRNQTFSSISQKQRLSY